MDGQFLRVLRKLLSSDNAARSAAEEQYNKIKVSKPELTIACHVILLEDSQLELPVREQAAVLLRQCLVGSDEAEAAWSFVDPTGRKEVKRKLLRLVQTEQASPVRRKVARCVETLGKQLLDTNEWPELVPHIMGTVGNTELAGCFRADALQMIKELMGELALDLVTNSDQTLMWMQSCLADADAEVQAAAFVVLCEFVGHLPSSEELALFAQLVPQMFEVLDQLASKNAVSCVTDSLQALVSAAEVPDFFNTQLGTHVLPAMCTIGSSSSADDSCRRLALEVLVTLGESGPRLITEVPEFQKRTMELSCLFMLSIGDDLQEWESSVDPDQDSDELLYGSGKDAVDRLSRSMNDFAPFQSFMAVVQPILLNLMQIGDWKHVVAAVTILTVIVEFIDEEELVRQYFQEIFALLRASHPRVRHAAWTALLQFTKDQQDAVAFASDSSLPAKVLAEFLLGLDDPSARVCARCMQAFHYYGEFVEREDLQPFIQPIMEKLGIRLAGAPKLQMEAITSIAVIAQKIEDGFIQYYAHLMPVLKQVVANTLHKLEERQLLGKAFECIASLADVVGRDLFRADIVEIMPAMIEAMQAQGVQGNDPVQEYVMAAAERLCATMRDDFLPFVPQLLPGVLGKLKAMPKEVKHTDDVKNLDVKTYEEDVVLSMMQVGDKITVTAIKTSELQDLKNALECVRTLVKKLEKTYSPFLADTAHALLPIFDFSLTEEINELVFETWGGLCQSARSAQNASVLRQLCIELVQRLVPRLEQPPTDIPTLKTNVEGLATCLEKAGPGVLREGEVRDVCQLAMRLLTESLSRRESAANDAANTDQEDVIDPDDDGEEMLRASLCVLPGSMMKHYPDVFMDVGLGLFLPVVQRLIQPGAHMEDQQQALMLASTILEHLGMRVVQHWSCFLPQIVQDIQHEADEIRVPSCYAIFLAAKLAAFEPFAAEAARKLEQVIQQARAMARKKSAKASQMAADNACSALAQILITHPSSVKGAEARLWSLWLASLPCQEDETEGNRNHRTLLEALKQERVEVVGSRGENVPRILQLLVDAYQTEMADEELSRDVGYTFIQIGEARLEQQAAIFTEKQRSKLVRIVREAHVSASAI